MTLEIERTFPRAPLDMAQKLKNSCLSCVVANVLHMFGVGVAECSWVDERIGRAPGVEGSVVRACLLLQSLGLGVRMVGEYSGEEFLRAGLSYLRAYYAEEWCEAWEEWCTPACLAEHRAQALLGRELAARGAVAEYRRPGSVDVIEATAAGSVVLASVANGDAVQCHTELVYRCDWSWTEVYSPQYTESCLFCIPRRVWESRWLVSEGIIVVSAEA